MLMLTTILLSIAVSMSFIIHGASAKVCTSDNNNNDNNNYGNAITTCTTQPTSNAHDHFTSKSSTPFILAVPFP
jgi:hypothetical protein